MLCLVCGIRSFTPVSGGATARWFASALLSCPANASFRWRRFRFCLKSLLVNEAFGMVESRQCLNDYWSSKLSLITVTLY